MVIVNRTHRMTWIEIQPMRETVVHVAVGKWWMVFRGMNLTCEVRKARQKMTELPLR